MPLNTKREPCPACGCPGEKYDGHVCEDYEARSAATLPEKLRAKAWLLLRRREATFEDEAAANLMLRAAKALEADLAA